MARLIKDKGVVALARIILNLANQTGIDNALKIVENSPAVFVDLLSNKNLISKKLKDISLQSLTSDWNIDNVEDNLEKLKLTSYQALILQTIIKHKNSATLDNLIKEFKRKKIKVGTGSMIGGSLAGISKKCVSYGIPKVVKVVKKNNQDIYSIVANDEETILKFKESLKEII